VAFSFFGDSGRIAWLLRKGRLEAKPLAPMPKWPMNRLLKLDPEAPGGFVDGKKKQF
jgi:hypothetical protein